MHTYSTLTVRELLEALAAGTPAPGGGATAALVGAAAGSLLLMVARLPQKQPRTPEATTQLDAASARLLPLRDTLLALVDRDAQAYADVIRARGLPRHDHAQTEERRRAIDAAMRAACETVLEVMRACSGCLLEAPVIARHGSRSAVADLRVAVELLQAAARAAATTVTANLETIRDGADAARAKGERDRLQQEIADRGRGAV